MAANKLFLNLDDFPSAIHVDMYKDVNLLSISIQNIDKFEALLSKNITDFNKSWKQMCLIDCANIIIGGMNPIRR